MAGALAAKAHLGGECWVEQDDCFGGQRTILGSPERQGIHPGFPRHLRGGAAQGNQRVGKPGTVHVESQGACLTHLTDGGDFVQVVEAADFSGLGNADAGRLGGVHVTDLFTCPFAQAGYIQLGRGAVDGHQLCAVGKELRGAAFIVVDMAGGMAIDVAPGWRHRTQAQAVGGGAGRDEKDLHVALEDLAELELDL
ncbi:hypothetical protein D3C76_707530 [compost metagenome]